MQPTSWISAVLITSVFLNSGMAVVESATSSSGAHAQALTDVMITAEQAGTEDSTYYFTMTLPERPAAGFTTLSFTEQYRDQGTDSLQFDLALTEAFLGTPEAIDRAIGVETWIDETGTFWVEFDSAIPPATTLTITFKERRAPSGEFYEYGIAAYPATEDAVAVFVGNGTLMLRQ